MLDAALNKGNKPPIIADRIEVVELEMGKQVRIPCPRAAAFFQIHTHTRSSLQPPELEIRDIGDLTVDQFRGIFRLSYAGDAHIVLRTKVQVW
jgi:distribution and morphology protein 34